MGLAIFATIVCLIFWLGSGNSAAKDEAKITKAIALGGIIIIWITYLLNDEKYSSPWVYIIFIAVAGYFYSYVRKVVKKNQSSISMKETLASNFIKAKKESYWDIPSQRIIDFFNYRREIKSDRVETHLNKPSKEFYRIYGNDEKYLTSNIFHEMRDLELTRLSNLAEISKINLYNKIYEKIKEFNDSIEMSIDYEGILKENDNIAEYFLIDLWCRFTKPFNIGTANLIVLARNFTQSELIGALDNADLNSVKRHGAGLYFKYALFKNLIPQEVLDEEKHAAELLKTKEQKELKQLLLSRENKESPSAESIEESITFYEKILNKEAANEL